MSSHPVSGDVTGIVTAGRYVFEVGGSAGTRLTLALADRRMPAAPLAEALRGARPSKSGKKDETNYRRSSMTPRG